MKRVYQRGQKCKKGQRVLCLYLHFQALYFYFKTMDNVTMRGLTAQMAWGLAPKCDFISFLVVFVVYLTFKRQW